MGDAFWFLLITIVYLVDAAILCSANSFNWHYLVPPGLLLLAFTITVLIETYAFSHGEIIGYRPVELGFLDSHPGEAPIYAYENWSIYSLLLTPVAGLLCILYWIPRPVWKYQLTHYALLLFFFLVSTAFALLLIGPN
jgi:hypothetical protein